MKKLTYEQAKLAEEQTLALLNSIGPAQNNPFTGYFQLVEVITALEKTLKMLKAFVRFISGLNPVQYLEWMQKAYASWRLQDQNENLFVVDEEPDFTSEANLKLMAPEKGPDDLKDSARPAPGPL